MSKTFEKDLDWGNRDSISVVLLRLVVSELKMVDFVLLLLFSHIYFLILDLGLEYSMTVTNCYSIWHCVTYITFIITQLYIIQKNVKNNETIILYKINTLY